MSLFEWNEKYSVNIKEVDNQHKILVSSLNELFEAMKNQEAQDVITGILESLSDYVGIHFSYEEKLMQEYNYPDYLKHKKMHDEFSNKVVQFVAKNEKKRLMLSFEVMNFLKDWLKNHIQGTDKMYAPFLNERGVT